VAVGLVLAAAVWSLVAATGVFPRALFPTIPEIARA
jgi:sulfonate transport system permease protein